MTRKMWLCVTVAVAALAIVDPTPLVPVASAQTADTSPPLDPAVRTGHLPNGLTYYIRRNETPENQISMELAVRAGTTSEDEDQLELAHLLEHLVADSSKEIGGQPWSQHFKAHGMQGDASTGPDMTNYYFTLPADQPELLESAYRMLRDWAQGAPISAQDLDDERGVVVSEHRGGSPQDGLQTAFLLRQDSGTSSGSRERSVLGASLDQVMRFYTDWYRPDLQAIIIVGDIDVDAAEAKVKTVFADLKMPANPRPPVDIAKVSLPLTGDSGYLVVTDPDASSTTVRFYLKRKSESPVLRSAADYRQRALENLFSTMLRARVAQLTEHYSAPFNRVSAQYSPLPNTATLNIDATMAEIGLWDTGMLRSGVELVLKEFERIRRDGFLPSELAAARSNPALREGRGGAPTSDELVQQYHRHFIAGELAPSPEAGRQLREESLRAVTLDEVNRFAATRLDDAHDFDIVVQAPESARALIPTEAEIRGWADSVRTARVEPYVEQTMPERLMSLGEVAALPAAAIVKQARTPEIGLDTMVLSNGITLLIRPTPDDPNSAGAIQISGFRPGGSSALPEQQRETAAEAGQLVQNSGVGGLDKFTLQRFASRHKISAHGKIDPDRVTLFARGRADNVEEALQYLYLTATRPTITPEAFADWRAMREREIARDAGSARAAFAAEVKRQRFGQEPARSADLAGIEAQRALAIYRDRISQTGDFTFVVTGDFEPANAVPMLVRYLGALPASRSKAAATPLFTPHPKLGNGRFIVRSGYDTTVDVELYFTGTFEDTLYNRIILELLGQALNERIWERIREREGGAYGPTGGMNIFRANPGQPDGQGIYSATVRFDPAPENVDRLIAAAREEIARLQAEGLDEALYRSVVDGALASARTRVLPPPGIWSSHLEDALRRDEDPTEVLKRQSIIRDMLTREDLNAAASRYLTQANAMEFILLPEASE